METMLSFYGSFYGCSCAMMTAGFGKLSQLRGIVTIKEITIQAVVLWSDNNLYIYGSKIWAVVVA